MFSALNHDPDDVSILCPNSDFGVSSSSVWGRDNVKFYKTSESLLKSRCLVQLGHLRIARTNSWEIVAKLRPHGDNFNEKRTVLKGRHALIDSMGMDIGDYKWLPSLRFSKVPLPPPRPVSCCTVDLLSKPSLRRGKRASGPHK